MRDDSESPFETLHSLVADIHHGHGAELWPEIERLARSDAPFLRALREVWAYEPPEYDRREALLAEFDD